MGFVARLLAVLLAAHAFQARAQTLSSITVRVVDQTGAPLPGVSITLTIATSTWNAVSDTMGEYTFTGMPAGAGELVFRLVNYAAVRRTLTVGTEPAAVEVVLPLSLSADVVVTGTATFRNVGDVEDPAANLVGVAAKYSKPCRV
jgi:hypothetical protein